jgi:hypothetical protein
MSNIQKPYPGTRDFYMQRNLSETPERSKRIEAKNALV